MKTGIFVSEDEIFKLAREVSGNHTQNEIAEILGCNQAAVSRMLNADPKLISLAMQWIAAQGGKFEEDAQRNQRRRYYKMLGPFDGKIQRAKQLVK